MSLRLTAKLAPGAGLRAVLLSLARQAKRDVERMSEAPEAHIHSLRTGMKKFRSLLRLAGNGIKKQERDAFLERVRILKDGMAGSRDEAVVFQTVKRELGEEATDRLGLRCPHLEKRTPAPEPLRQAATELVPLAEALDFAKVDEKKLRQQWKRTGGKARQAGKRAAKSGNAHDFHAWRKRAKDLWYQSSALSGLIKKAGGRGRLARKLSDELGMEHDLTVALELVKEFTDADRAALNARREERRNSALAC